MKIPLIYNLRSVKQRPVSTALTALGIGLVVAVFVAMLALANGFIAALATTGSTDNVLLLRRGADSELSSGIPREAISIIAASPHVATAADGRPLISPETYIVLNLKRPGGDEYTVANVVARGVSDKAFEVRRSIKIVEGRRFASGQSEVCVGAKLKGRFENVNVGDVLRFSNRDWKVVCRFTADGSSFESEIWGENEQFQNVFRYNSFQDVAFRLKDPGGFAEAQRAFLADQRLQVDAHRESEFYASQSELLGNILRFLAIMITSIMAVGAVFGAVNTMYAAVSSRTPEIAVLLTLGFHPRSVLASFLAESAVIAFIGGVVGCLLALPINGVVTSTTNWASFSDVAFAFRVTPGLLGAGVGFAVAMGVIGGFFPARRASKLPVIQALR
ncbi:MacB-like periplasmic core domain protein (plasmid) [Gemmatirosa kalamazoonensis]|uniref:MacB-like periplasmic core domain protein n=1 Tax=Gemmatirosa kalamazoonensis TaxID=861299 RepID=W0RT75_9BACT|nr:FtsX-like permease family protein [Gemmatirosa kalamazoonensis]AHG93525.1 MacB-like periplasmic core domain protein [Gemmatirosa kalamazoonensis]